MSLERRAVITGLGLLCPMGDSPEALHGGLCRAGLTSVPRAATSVARPLAPEAPDPYLCNRNAYPLDRPARLLVAAAQLALADGGWSPQELNRADVSLFVGTMFSSAHTISRFDCQAVREGPTYASPLDFANTVINAPSGQAAIWHGLRGVNKTVATGASSGLEAIGSAAEAVWTGLVACALAGGVEELSPESFRAFEEAGLLCDTCHDTLPFDPRSGGLVLSESAALLVLEDGEVARRRGAPLLAEVRGHGQAFDVSRRRDERRSVRSIARSMHLAMEQAQVGPGEIDVVCASASGVVSVDRHEALAIGAVFEKQTELPPVSAVKSLLGEPLGAAGALQCAAMIQSMRTGLVPAALDLSRFPDAVVPFVPHADFPRDGFRTCLINSLSYDGHSCSLVLSSSAACESLVAHQKTHSGAQR
jgi:3-oxoacyl-[acyl-carrier-protein] synthase II